MATISTIQLKDKQGNVLYPETESAIVKRKATSAVTEGDDAQIALASTDVEGALIELAKAVNAASGGAAADLSKVKEDLGTVASLNTTVKTSAVDAINEVYNTVTANAEAAKVSVATSNGSVDSILKTYTFTQDGATIGTVDIPKDLVLTSGSVVSAYKATDGTISETTSEGATAIKALKLVIANQTDPVYVDVDTLVDHFDGSSIYVTDPSDGTSSVLLNTELATIYGKATANEDAIKVLNGSATDNGSVAKAVKDAVDALDATKNASSTYVSVTLNQEDGVITSISLNDTIDYSDIVKIADDSADYLTASSNSISVNVVSLGSAAGVEKDTDGNWVTTNETVTSNGFANAQEVSSIIVEDEKVIAAALNDLQSQINAATANHTVVATANGTTHITLSSASADGQTTYTIGESDIASKSDLDTVSANLGATDAASGNGSAFARIATLEQAAIAYYAVTGTYDDGATA